MKRLFILLVLTPLLSIGQITYKTFESKSLNQTRELKIQLPRNYDENTEKSYPIFIVFDGDYLFEPVAGNVDYFSFWEDMPQAIVVGINQQKTRNDDTYYDEVNFLPSETGADFFEFVGLELLPYLDENYRTAKFVVAVGHDFTANFLDFYLLKKPPLFQGYVNLSPDFAPAISERIYENLSASEEKIWFYMATGTDDIKGLREDILLTHDEFKTIENENLNYYFDDFEGATHYTVVGRAIPKAIEDIFSVYRPISTKEYNETLLTLDGSLYEYLIEKYQIIQELYGLDNKIRLNDFQAISAAISKREKWDEYEPLGKLARKEHPDTMLGSYYLARYYEETGEPKKAMRTYQKAFQMSEIGNLTKDMMLEKSDALKADFGY